MVAGLAENPDWDAPSLIRVYIHNFVRHTVVLTSKLTFHFGILPLFRIEFFEMCIQVLLGLLVPLVPFLGLQLQVQVSLGLWV